MKEIEVNGATSTLDECARDASKHPLILTRHGKPVAAVIPMKYIDRESLSLSQNPEFLAILERSRERRRKEGGISSEEIRRQFGLKPFRKK